jgi:hypothetical protein
MVTDEQKEIYDKNCKLFMLVFKHRHKYGSLISLCCNLGSQDYWDKNRFVNTYYHSNAWYKLACGKSFKHTPDFVIQ